MAQYPQLEQITAAIEAYQAGKAITAACPKCHQLLNVAVEKSAGSLIVNCQCGHCYHRLNWQV